MMIDKRLINTVADSKKWIGVTVLWNWVALVVGWAKAHPTLNTHHSMCTSFYFRSNYYDDFIKATQLLI
ncbi:hypothetical protein C3P63_02075 [Haemophilus influenzae]|nr:hypothetical protein C3P63_02075 [Haemophilus influenzae]